MKIYDNDIYAYNDIQKIIFVDPNWSDEDIKEAIDDCVDGWLEDEAWDLI